MIGVTGTLGLFSLVDLFQLLSSSARTGRLAIDHPEARAKVYFDKGQVVHAEFGDMVGDDAVYALFDDEQGSFEFTIGLPAPRNTIGVSTENLMLESIRRLDESRRDSGHEGVARSAVPVFTDKDAANLTLLPNEIEVLRRIDGSKNVTELAQGAGVEPETVMQVVGRLIKVGVLKLRSSAPRTARLVSKLTPQRLPTGVVGVDIGIMTTWQRSLGTRPDRIACKRADGRVLTFPVQAVEGAGPHLYVTRETLFQTGLSVDETLLVKPVAGAEPR